MGNSREILKLKPLISKDRIFYQKCKTHVNKFCSTYCISCDDKPVCFTCSGSTEFKERHQGHHVLHVQKSTHKNAIKMDDLKMFTDGSDILQLINNGTRVLMIASRRDSEGNVNGHHGAQLCVRCAFPIKPSTTQPRARYCSLQCKVASVEKLLTPSSALSADAADHSQSSSMVTALAPGCGVCANSPASSDDVRSCVSYRIKSRKWHPYRSPLY